MSTQPRIAPSTLSFDVSTIGDKFEDLTEEEQELISDKVEEFTAYASPEILRKEIREFDELVGQAKLLEGREVESKLSKLKEVLITQRVFEDPNMKLLIFTEHTDTLNYLVGKIKAWGLSVTQIHGGMPIGNINMPGTRIFAENEFKKSCQIMVATEAAGEGINLQFCWFMINYDIPWNPMRLEQRMGRIHRYGQEKDCLIFNFVSTNTREGRVLHKLLERLGEIRRELGTDHVFDVIGDVFRANELEKLFRDLYADNTTENAIQKRIVDSTDPERFRNIVNSTLEGLAKKELNLSAIVGKCTEAMESRLVPKAIENFFLQGAGILGLDIKLLKKAAGLYRVGKLPRSIINAGERLEERFGKLAAEYTDIVFDKELIGVHPQADWITPGHPLFETVREETLGAVNSDLRAGAVFYDLKTNKPYFLTAFTAAVKDGNDNVLLRRLFVIETSEKGTAVRQPTIFADLDAVDGTPVFELPSETSKPETNEIEAFLVEQALLPLMEDMNGERQRQIELISRHVEISLNALIHRQNMRMAELMEQQAETSETHQMVNANLKQTEDRLDELNRRLETRMEDLMRERQCSMADIQLVGEVLVLPHPERNTPEVKAMVSNQEIERIAVDAVIAFENARGWVVESVESENKGFDLISRKFHPENPETVIDVRFIEVKGRAQVGEVVLTLNEFNTAAQMKENYWLYVVFNCGTTPNINIINNPARLGWQPVQVVERFSVPAKEILEASE